MQRLLGENCKCGESGVTTVVKCRGACLKAKGCIGGGVKMKCGTGRDFTIVT
jgi:hypothetical protein